MSAVPVIENNKSLRYALRLLFLVALVVFCFRFIVPRWQELQLSDRLETLSVSWILFSIVVFGAHRLTAAMIWNRALGILGHRPSLISTFRAYALSLLTKYIPGKIATVGVRTTIIAQAGVSHRAALASLSWETVLWMLSGSVIAIAGLLFLEAPFLPLDPEWLAVILAVGVLVLTIIALSPLSRSRHAEWIGLRQLEGNKISVLGLFGLYLLAWLMPGLGHWGLARSLTILDPLMVFPLTVAVAASWLVGVVAFFAPAGIGVREGALYPFAAMWLGPADALLFVLLSRVVIFLVEVLVTGVWFVMSPLCSDSVGKDLLDHGKT